MKNGSKLIVIGILSLLVGTAFASPLLIVELDEIRQYNEPLPAGPTADIIVNAVYANFSVGDTTFSEVYNKDVTEMSYFVVLNITNNSDEWATVGMVTFDVAEEVTTGISDSVLSNWTSSSGWESEGAWVDGVWYNLTWVPHDGFWINCSSLIHGVDMWGDFSPISEGYWMEGVQLCDKAVGDNVTNIYMNMNGTWVDVTGRIEWLDDDGNVVDISSRGQTSQGVTVSGTYFGQQLTFGVNKTDSNDDSNTDIGLNAIIYAPLDFDNLWAPHQSRLIALTYSKQVFANFLDSSKVEQLKTEEVTFRTSVHSYIKDTIGTYDSNAVEYEVKQIKFDITEDGYLYNTVLSDDQMFVMDSFGMEVFIEQRN